MTKNGGLCNRSTPPVAAAAFNSKTPKTSMDSTGLSIYTSKEETRPFSPEQIRPLPKPGHRKGHNVKKKRTTAILTDTPVKKKL